MLLTKLENLPLSILATSTHKLRMYIFGKFLVTTIEAICATIYEQG